MMIFDSKNPTFLNPCNKGTLVELNTQKTLIRNLLETKGWEHHAIRNNNRKPD